MAGRRRVKEERRFVRFPAMCRVEYPTGVGVVVAFTGELSSGGMFVKQAKQVKSGDEILCTLHLDGEAPVVVRCRVCRVATDGAGLEFLASEKEAVGRVRRFIEARLAAPLHDRVVGAKSSAEEVVRYAMYCAEVGRFDEALEAYRRALEREPQSLALRESMAAFILERINAQGETAWPLVKELEQIVRAGIKLGPSETLAAVGREVAEVQRRIERRKTADRDKIDRELEALLKHGGASGPRPTSPDGGEAKPGPAAEGDPTPVPPVDPLLTERLELERSREELRRGQAELEKARLDLATTRSEIEQARLRLERESEEITLQREQLKRDLDEAGKPPPVPPARDTAPVERRDSDELTVQMSVTQIQQALGDGAPSTAMNSEVTPTVGVRTKPRPTPPRVAPPSGASATLEPRRPQVRSLSAGSPPQARTSAALTRRRLIIVGAGVVVGVLALVFVWALWSSTPSEAEVNVVDTAEPAPSVVPAEASAPPVPAPRVGTESAPSAAAGPESSPSAPVAKPAPKARKPKRVEPGKPGNKDGIFSLFDSVKEEGAK